MRPVLDADQMRAWDESWMARGVPSALLMENAGRGAAHLIGLKAKPRRPGEPPRTGSSVAGTCVRCSDEKSLLGVDVLILCGPGNNGGDGFVVARHLAARGTRVRVWCLTGRDKLSAGARDAWTALEAVGISAEPIPEPEQWAGAFSEATIVVDALLGTGTARPLEGRLRALVETLNESRAFVIALDVPTGLDATTGAELGVAVRAAHTVTFGHFKQGLLTTAGHLCSGTITLSHLGVPSDLGELEPRAWLLEESDVRARLNKRSPVSHKGAAGRVVAVAGSPGTLGAARLCSRAALRGGAGLVWVATHPEAIDRLEAEVAEVMTHRLADDETSREFFARADAFIVGPGLGQSETAAAFLELTLAAGHPTVVDADALRLIAKDPPRWKQPSNGRLQNAVLTPHPAEAAALLGTSVDQVESDRFAAARRLANDYETVVLLKGSRSLVARPNAPVVVSAFGSPALATGGSGDVLSGLLAAGLVGATGQHEIFERCWVGLGLQGIAAERWEKQHGASGLLASEIADLVPEVVRDLLS